MKKLLALVMALVMVMGLATVGTSAAVKFSDAADINYKEAVDVLSTIGVLQGDENGFRPKDQLKRSEGAKILAYLMLQPSAAEQMTGGGKFTDVPATHWAAGYIEYLSVEGVIAGVGDNKFDPDGPLTTAAFTKMLLGALGYDAQIEGMIGADWMINAQRLAKKVGLFDGNPNAVISSNITREEAALYAFNMICSPLVEYENKGSTLSVNGATIDFGASKASYRVNTGKKQTRYTQIDTITTNQNTTDSQIIEFGEEFFEKLVLNNHAGKNNNYDDYGRPTNKWVYDGKKIGEYKVKEELLYTTTVTLGQIYKDLALTTGTEVDIMIDGLHTGVSTWYVDGVMMPVIKLEKESNTKIGGNGCETYVYYDEGEVRISCMNWYVGDVAGVYAATSSKDAYIYVAGRSGDDSHSNVVSGEKDVTGFSVDDVVRYNAHLKWDGTGEWKLDNIEKAEVVKGKLDAFVMYGMEGLMDSATGSVTLAGKNYVYSAQVAGTPDGTFIKSNVELDIVLDKYGYVLDVSDYGVQNFAVVTKASAAAGDFNDAKKVELVFTDGTSSGTVTLNGDDHDSKDYGTGKFDDNGVEIMTKMPTYGKGAAAEVVLKGDIVTYSVGSNGKYSLKLMRHGWKSNFDGERIIINGTSFIDLHSKDNLTEATHDASAEMTNGKTVFIIKDTEGNVKVYEGIKNVPSILGGAKNIEVNAFAKTKALNKQNGSAASVVWINLDGTDASMYNNETVFVHYDASHNKAVSSGSDPYYEFEAVVNGEKKTLKIDTKTYDAALDLFNETTFNGDFYVLYRSITTNSKGIATLSMEEGAKTFSKGLKNGTIGLGYDRSANYNDGANIVWYTLASNCKVFYINENNEIQPSSAGSIPDYEKTGEKVYCWYSFDNTTTDINYIFWTKQAVKTVKYGTGNNWALPASIKTLDNLTADEANERNSSTGPVSTLQKSLRNYDGVVISDIYTSTGYNLPVWDYDASNEVTELEKDHALVVEGSMTVPKEYKGVNAFAVNGYLYVEGTLYINGIVNVAKTGLITAERIVINAGGQLNYAGDWTVPIDFDTGAGTKMVVKGDLTVAGKLVVDGDMDILDAGTVTASVIEINGHVEENGEDAKVTITGDKQSIIAGTSFVQKAGESSFKKAKITGAFEITGGTAKFTELVIDTLLFAIGSEGEDADGDDLTGEVNAQSVEMTKNSLAVVEDEGTMTVTGTTTLASGSKLVVADEAVFTSAKAAGSGEIDASESVLPNAVVIADTEDLNTEIKVNKYTVTVSINTAVLKNVETYTDKTQPNYGKYKVTSFEDKFGEALVAKTNSVVVTDVGEDEAMKYGSIVVDGDGAADVTYTFAQGETDEAYVIASDTVTFIVKINADLLPGEDEASTVQLGTVVVNGTEIASTKYEVDDAEGTIEITTTVDTFMTIK